MTLRLHDSQAPTTRRLIPRGITLIALGSLAWLGFAALVWGVMAVLGLVT